MDDVSLADVRHQTATTEQRWRAIRERTTRGMLTFNAGGVVRLEGDLWAVRSTRGGFHRVDLGAETCTCEDFNHYGRAHGVNCRHIYAVAIAHATRRRHRPCACNGGWVSIGQIALDPETGEEAEEFALYLCRRCAGR